MSMLSVHTYTPILGPLYFDSAILANLGSRWTGFGNYMVLEIHFLPLESRKKKLIYQLYTLVYGRNIWYIVENVPIQEKRRNTKIWKNLQVWQLKDYRYT